MSLSTVEEEEPALFQLIRTGTSVDAVRLYLSYFPASLELPTYQEQTVIVAAVRACFVKAETWQGEQDNEALELRLHILQIVVEHTNLVEVTDRDEQTIFHNVLKPPIDSISSTHYGLVRDTIFDLLLEKLIKHQPMSSVLFHQNPDREMAIHIAISNGDWRSTSKLLRHMHQFSRINNLCESEDYYSYYDCYEEENAVPLLQHILRNNPRSKVLKEILTLFPDSAAARTDHNGKLPLVTALENTLPARKLELLIVAYPQALRTPTPVDLDLPLHLAAMYYQSDEHAPVEVLRLLMYHNANAVFTANTHGQWPLHCAMEQQEECPSNHSEPQSPQALDVAVLQLLSSQQLVDSDNFSEQIYMETSLLDAMDIIDTSVLSSPSISSRSSTQSAQPCQPIEDAGDCVSPTCLDVLCHKDCYGDLPLHIACRRLSSVSIESFTWLLQSHPEAARVANEYGHLPLHLAAVNADQIYARSNSDEATNDHTLECVKLLLSVCPEAVYQPDNEGDVPLQCAFTHANVSLTVLQCLLHATSNDIEPIPAELNHVAENLSTGQLPLHTACVNSIFSDATISALLAYDPTALLHHDHDGNLPIHVALMQNPVCPVSILKKLLFGAAAYVEQDDHVLHCSHRLYQSTVPCNEFGVPALFVACESAKHTTGDDPSTSELASLDIIRFLVEVSPELFTS